MRNVELTKNLSDYQEQYFYSLCRKDERSQRKCIRCKKEFFSTNKGNRTCFPCREVNSKYSVKCY